MVGHMNLLKPNNSATQDENCIVGMKNQVHGLHADSMQQLQYTKVVIRA